MTQSHGTRDGNQEIAAHCMLSGLHHRRLHSLTCPGKREYSLRSDKSTGICVPEECSRSPSRITDLLFSFPLLSQPIWPSRMTGSYQRVQYKNDYTEKPQIAPALGGDHSITTERVRTLQGCLVHLLVTRCALRGCPSVNVLNQGESPQAL